jgi:hypothetical protein
MAELPNRQVTIATFHITTAGVVDDFDYVLAMEHLQRFGVRCADSLKPAIVAVTPAGFGLTKSSLVVTLHITMPMMRRGVHRWLQDHLTQHVASFVEAHRKSGLALPASGVTLESPCHVVP